MTKSGLLVDYFLPLVYDVRTKRLSCPKWGDGGLCDLAKTFYIDVFSNLILNCEGKNQDLRNGLNLVEFFTPSGPFLYLVQIWTKSRSGPSPEF